MKKKFAKFIEFNFNPIKKIFVIVVDFFCLYFNFYFINLGFNFSTDEISYEALVFPISNCLISIILGNYRIVWGFFGKKDILYIAISVFVSVLILACFRRNLEYIYFYLFLFLISFCSITFLRLIYAKWRIIFRFKKTAENIVIIGAGEAGAQLYEQLTKVRSVKYNPIGFLDDSTNLKNRTVLGAPVLGEISEIKKIKKKYNIKKGIIAIPSATESQISKIFNHAIKAQLNLKTLPSIDHILDGRVYSHQIQDIDPENLLRRDSITLEGEIIRELIFNKIILITGAGGSIGSELTYQIAKLNPKKIILIEQTELFLYEINNKIKTLFPEISIVPIIGDVRDISKVEFVVSSYNPSIIFHAAAYKHVPLMEENPQEALVTNLIGTNNVATIAAKYNIPRFILVSTDKAVNPTNVMGATKRAAEIACQVISESNKNTKFMIVRFGNVLGSSGSVIPLFKRQILNGGPVTVTHKEVTRYFMSIPEACQLILYAGAIGNGGELFLLDMGEPIKILDLAKDMIRLSGYEPDKDIKIQFTGLRKGEKMYEELLYDKENILNTIHPKIKLGKSLRSDMMKIEYLNALLNMKKNSDLKSILHGLNNLIPEFKHKK